jgi:hypothetical protein
MDEERVFEVAKMAIDAGDIDLAEGVLALAKRYVLSRGDGLERESGFIVAERYLLKATRDEAIKSCVLDFNRHPRPV